MTEAQYQRIAHCLPVQRGNVRLSNRQVLNAILYVAEHGGKWPTVSARMNRWAKSGVLERVFEELRGSASA